MRAGKEDPRRIGERQGIASIERPSGHLIWIHAASVGESLSMLSVIARLRSEQPATHLLITTGTVTSARILEGRLPPGVIHQFAPADCPGWVDDFLGHWKPDLALWVESEFWPNLLLATSRRKVPMVLINARMSERSYRGWNRVPGTIRDLMGRFDLCLAQTEDEAAKLRSLGGRAVETPGNLKFAAEPLPAGDTAVADLTATFSGRPVWLAASTHPGEEALVAEAHRQIVERFPDLLTVIVPRHAARGISISEEIGGAVAVRSRGDVITDNISFYIGDSMGELGLFYRCIPVVFIGGSLVTHGGQNPLEPARLGCAVMHGPHMDNFLAITAELASAGATSKVTDAESLARDVELLLADASLRDKRASSAQSVAQAKTEILDSVFLALAPYLEMGHRSTARPVRHARA